MSVSLAGPITLIIGWAITKFYILYFNLIVEVFSKHGLSLILLATIVSKLILSFLLVFLEFIALIIGLAVLLVLWLYIISPILDKILFLILRKKYIKFLAKIGFGCHFRLRSLSILLRRNKRAKKEFICLLQESLVDVAFLKMVLDETEDIDLISSIKKSTEDKVLRLFCDWRIKEISKEVI